MTSTGSHTERRIPVLVTEEQVAGIFSVTTRTVRNWARRGALTPVRIGGVTRYRAEEIERLTSCPEPDREEVADD